MIEPKFPLDEDLRLKELLDYNIMDTDPEKAFDDLTQLASEICETPISAISLIDSNRQWFKSKTGLDAQETPRNISWCGHAILGNEIFEIPDSILDERFADNPLVHQSPYVRFYAGAPIIMESGHKLGTICVIDSKPRTLSAQQKKALEILSRQVSFLIEARLREEKLNLALKKLDAIVNNIPIMLTTIDPEGNFTWVNNQWKKELGWDVNSMRGRDIMSDFFPSDEVREKAKSFIAEGQNTDWHDFNMRRKNEEYFYSSWINVKLDENTILGIGKNIHEKKVLEQLSNDMQRMAKIGGWYMTINDSKQFWTEEVYRIYGVPQGTQIDLKASINCYAPEERERLSSLIETAIKNKKMWDGEFKFHDFNGQFKWVRSMGEAILDDQGTVYKLQGTFQDITERKLLEIDLENEKLLAQQQSKLASLGQMAAGVGHEINNPLAILKGYIQILKTNLSLQDFSLSENLEFLEKMNSASDRISNIVKSMRSFSSMTIEERTSFNLVDAINDSYNFFCEICHQEKIKTSISLGEYSELFIFGNKGKIEQVIINLLVNAKDATEGLEHRQIKLSVDVENDLVFINVKDNGRGIQDSIKDRIYEPFFTTKEVNKGTGIGLSIISSIIKEHKGSVSFSKIEPQGTNFQISLELTQPPSLTSSEPKKIPIDKPTLKLKVLIVDDEEDIRFFLQIFLKKMALDIHVCENGKQALEKHQEENYDLIVTDMKMPVMDGLSLINAIRENQLLRQPKIILITGGTDSFALSALVTSKKVDRLIFKPFVESDINQKIKELFPELN